MDFEKSDWRVIFDQPAGGGINMAVDEAILESVVSGKSLPTLRFFSWEPAVIS